MRPRLSLRAVFLLLATALWTAPGAAQYIYLDSDGDGVRTSADRLEPVGPTTVDVWLRTDAERDGTPALCSAAGEFTINSYEFILQATGGTVSYDSFADAMDYAGIFGLVSNGTDFYAGRYGAMRPPGLFRLASLTITVVSGTPRIDFAPYTALSPAGYTSFGSQCPGLDVDNTLKLESDWFGADGLSSGPASSFAPLLTPIAAMSLLEGETAIQGYHASDPDADSLTVVKSEGPAFMTVTAGPGEPGLATGNITLAPNFSHSGTYTGGLQATDGVLIDERRFSISVTNVHQSNFYIPFQDVIVPQHRDTLIVLEATNPDYGPTYVDVASGPAFVTRNTSGFEAYRSILISPKLTTDVGTFVVALTVYGDNGVEPDTFLVTVLPNPLPPSVLIQPDVLYAHEEGRVLVQALDPDGGAILSLTFDDSGIPPSDPRTFTTSNEYRSGLVLWTPGSSGTYPLRFTAIDGSGATTTRELEVTVLAARPAVTAPARVAAIPLTLVTFTVSAAQPDGIPLTSLTLDATSATSQGATFTADASNQLGTFSWTPPIDIWAPVEGCLRYALTFRASDGVQIGTARTRLELALTDDDHLRTDVFDLMVTNAAQTGFESRNLEGGLFYPPTTSTPLLVGMGPWIGGKLGSSLRVSRGGGDTEFTPGIIESGLPRLFEPRFRNYRIDRGDVTSSDYVGWPVADGAPVTSGGAPKLEGSSLLWSVSQDLDVDARARRLEYSAPTAGAGVELRQTTFVYDGAGPLAHLAIVRYRFTNCSGTTMDSAFVGAFADPEIGGSLDDLVGYDRRLELGYAYNAAGSDAAFGTAPPALGVAWLGGSGPGGAPLPCGAFQTYHATDLATNALTAVRSYFYLQGKDAAGDPLHASDDKNAPVTTFRFDGDPVAGTGWRDDQPSDRRLVLGAGPVTLDVGESVEFTTALIVGQGADRLASVSELRRLAGMARYLASTGFVPSPYVDLPPTLDLTDGQPFEWHVEAFDPDGDALTTLTADLSSLPAGHGATFVTDPGVTGATFAWTPRLGHSQTFTVRMTAANDLASTFAAVLRVHGPNLAPSASAGGPYTGVAGVPLSMSAASSSDPDGDDLTVAWDFGDGNVGAGTITSHAYGALGSYRVIAAVSDGFASGADTTGATIQSAGAASAWESSGATPLRLASPRDAWCFQLEPIGNVFPLSSISGPIRLVWQAEDGPRSVDEIPGQPTEEDRDGDGIQERRVCFAAEDFRSLFSDLPAGTWSRTIALEGSLSGGGGFSALVSVEVAVPGSLVAVVAPNPLNPGGTLTVRTSHAGRARVTIHDVQGRGVRTLHDGFLGAGIHDFAIDGRNAAGVRLGSGVYFYRIATDEGSSRGRFTVLK